MKYFYKGNLAYSSHSQIADFIIKKKLKKILDIGCNQGFIGQALRERKWKGFITGVDIDDYWRRFIFENGYTRFLNLDVEKDLLKIKEKFDAIVFSDVLEHLKNPSKVLINSKKIIKEDGLFLISLPNVANFFMRINLLLGNFNYLNYGILDKSHLHFYTYKTARNLVMSANLMTIEESCTPMPTPLVNNLFAYKKPFFFVYYIARLFSLIRKEIFAYQFIFVCKKCKNLI